MVAGNACRPQGPGAIVHKDTHTCISLLIAEKCNRNKPPRDRASDFTG